MANWECVRGTSYIYPGTPLSPTRRPLAFDGAGLRDRRCTSTRDCADWTPPRSQSFFATQLARLRRPVTRASRAGDQPHALHRLERLGERAEGRAGARHPARHELLLLAAAAGCRTARACSPAPGCRCASPTSTARAIDVYQATTQMTDESGQTYPFTIDTLLDNALGTAGYYGVFTANMHTDSAPIAGSDAIVASAQARGVPVVSAPPDARPGSTAATAPSFGAIAWSGNTLSFRVTAGAGANGLRAMVPATFGASRSWRSRATASRSRSPARPSRACATPSSPRRSGATRRATDAEAPPRPDGGEGAPVAGSRRRGLLVLQRLEHVEPRGAAGGHDRRADARQHRDQREAEQRLQRERDRQVELDTSRARPAPCRRRGRARRRSAP